MNPSPLQRIVDNALRFNGLATHNHRGFVCGLNDDASQQVNDGKNDQIRRKLTRLPSEHGRKLVKSKALK